MKRYFSNLLLALIVLATNLVVAQTTDEEFGRNRVQYEDFKWRYLSSENFDVYFYQGGDKIAKEVAEYLEDEFDRVTDLIGYPPYSKTKLFLYNSVSDLQQSNVGIDQYGVSPSGETQFIKPYIEVAHPGSIGALKEELLVKVSTLMVNEMMFGGSLKDMFQSSVLLNLPEWFINGAALYVANGWSMEMDDFVRDYIKTRKPEKLNRLMGREAALAGQSVWNYIAQQYGRSNISNILNYTRIIRNEEKSIEITLGVPFEQVIYNWQTYYLNIDQQVSEKYMTAPEEQKINKKNRKGKLHKHVAVNTSGTKIAYTENDQGRFKVLVRDVASNNEKKVLTGGYKVINQDIDVDLPLIDWVDSATLGIIYPKKGKLWFELYDLNTNSRLPRQLDRFEGVQSMSFSDNGRLLIISAMVNGQNDLYLLSTRRDRTKRLSFDIFDDIDATFVPNTNTIAFSSNRSSDTLNLSEKNFEAVGSDNYNIFFYNLDTTKELLHRVTNTISKDSHPIVYNSNTIYYLSDQKGINNLFKYDRSTQIYSQITNYESSIQDFDINFSNNQLAYSMSQNGVDHIYFKNDFDRNSQTFTPITPRQQVIQAREFRARRSAKVDETITIQDIVESRLKENDEATQTEQVADTIVSDRVTLSDSLSLISDSVEVVPDTLKVPEQVEEPDDETETAEIIDTDDYKFETDVIEEAQGNRDSFLAQYRKLRQKNTINGPFPYEPRFSANNLITSFVMDPLRGFGIFLQTEMYDILENHKFKGGVMVTTDLRSGDIFGEYHYLKARVDYNARFERNVILRETGNSLKKYSKNTFQLGAALPFNNKLRFEVNPFFTFTKYDDLDPINGSVSPPRFNKSEKENYIGASTQLVYDNSVVNGMNIIEGSRAKIKFIHYEGVDNKDASFSNISIDLRHYQKIHREIVLAGRLFYGSFFGRSPKEYLLGGMDNWLLIREENTEGANNPLSTEREGNNSELLFVEYATNLRGFDYARIVGHNTLLFNAELRVPIIRYLSSGPISSNFFRNLQFTGFFDIGSAWTGKSPFNEDNKISTDRIENGSFVIDIKDFQNPWLYSYGAGMRSMVLGYYLKLDVAWPVEDFTVNDPRVLLTLGYDF